MAFSAKLESAVVLAVALMGSAAVAQEPSMPRTGPGGPSELSGFEVGVRSGYGIPLGTSGDGVSFSDIYKGAIPFWGDVGYRIDPNWYIGGFYQFALGFLPSNAQGCSGSGISCSVTGHRFGANVHYHFLPDRSVDPWVGLGAGYEILKASTSSQAGSASASTNGFEFGNVQLGVDYKLSPAFAIGPFGTFTFARFSGRSASVSGQDIPIGDYTNKALHEWLIFGLRGAFDVLVD